MDAGMNEKKNKSPIKNEAANGLKNNLGTLAMARTNVVDSATSQFFINVKNNDFLNHRSTAPAEFGYAVFGKVIEGMDVVHSIEKVRTGNKGGHQDVPVDAVVINSAKVGRDGRTIRVVQFFSGILERALRGPDSFGSYFRTAESSSRLGAAVS